MREDIWTAADDRLLLDAVRRGMSYRDIANTYFKDRTYSGVKCRGRRLKLGTAMTVECEAVIGSANLLAAQIRAGMVAHRPRQAWLERHGVVA